MSGDSSSPQSETPQEDTPEAALQRGLAALRAGRADAARAILAAAFKTWPHDWRLAYAQGEAARRLNDWAGAEAALAAALALNPVNLALLRALGDTYARLGRADLAARFARVAEQLEAGP